MMDSQAQGGPGPHLISADAAETAQEYDPAVWFREHYERAASEIVDYLSEDGFELRNKVVADIGCGDGIIDLGVCHKVGPAKLVGYDLKDVDMTALARVVERHELSQGIPDAEHLYFMRSEPDRIPAPNDSFDVVFSWSVFEHVSQPLVMCREIRRVLKPDGVFFLQVWPLYYSEHGGHLWPHYDKPAFPHLDRSDDEIAHDIRLSSGTYPQIDGLDEYRSLNRVRLDDLHRALAAGGMVVTKVSVMIEPTVRIPPELGMYSLSDLVTSGVKLLAVPRYK